MLPGKRFVSNIAQRSKHLQSTSIPGAHTIEAAGNERGSVPSFIAAWRMLTFMGSDADQDAVPIVGA
jgi:hypothetical protein